MYVDPSSGYKVFTEYAHLQRGKCCGSACRHVSSLFAAGSGSVLLRCFSHAHQLLNEWKAGEFINVGGSF